MEKIADLLTKFMISESSSENLDYEVCKFGLLIQMQIPAHLTTHSAKS